MSQNKELIQNKLQRKRLDSIPIVNGIEIEHPKEREMNLLEVEKPKERKRSRPDDDSEEEKMEIIQDVTDENMCVVETRVISGLIESIDEENVRSLIECFNPIIRSSPDHIKQTMLECSDRWENRNNTYIGAINYIAQGRQEKSSIEEKLEEKSLDELCEILIREIENRMPKHCGQCDEYYMVKLKDTPMLYCMWCKVGMHDCMENTNGIGNCKGIKWLCKTCDPVFTKHILPKIDPAASFEGFEIKKVLSVIEKSAESKETNKQVEKQNDKHKKDKPDEPVIIVHLENESDVEVNKSSPNENEINLESNINGGRNDNENSSKEICWFWKNKKCRFTINCKKQHPEHCKDILETGLCKDSRCKLIHPKICRNIFFKGYCHRGETCWYTHPSKCQNGQPNNMTNVNNSWGSTQDNQNKQSSINQNWVNQNQIQNFTRNSRDFLGQWPQLRNNSNISNQIWKDPENQTMIQMMENMMQKMEGMNNKIMRMETGWQYSNRM